MSSRMEFFTRKIRDFSRSTRGNVAMMFALATVPLMIGAGVGLDYARAMLVRQQMSEALVTRDKTRVRIVRQGESFVGAEPADLPQASARALAETLATLRAVRAVGYAAGDPSHGFAKPFATLAITIGAQSGNASVHTLLLGADAGEGARYARRADQPAVLVLSRDAVERLTDPAKPR